MSSKSPRRNYHDYVIKEGKFIGAFDEMYRDCPDPWHQDTIQSLAEDIALLMVASIPSARILDIGCGLGRFTDRICSATGGDVLALDTSPHAVNIAASRYPRIRFRTESVPPVQAKDAAFDLVITSEILWYVLPRMDELFTEIARVLVPGGHYLVIQQFYKPEEQQYGKDYLQRPEDIIAKVPMPLVRTVDMDRWTNHKFVGLFRKP